SRFELGHGEDSESHSVNAGGAYHFGPTLTADGSGGVFINRPIGSSNDRVAKRIGPTWSLSPSKGFQRSGVTLGASQQITSSAGIGGVSQTITGFMSGQTTLWQHLSGSVHASYIDFETDVTTFRLLTIQAGLSYPIWRYVSGGVSYSYRRSD